MQCKRTRALRQTCTPKSTKKFVILRSSIFFVLRFLPLFHARFAISFILPCLPRYEVSSESAREDWLQGKDRRSTGPDFQFTNFSSSMQLAVSQSILYFI
ncbi:hypothetical protein Nepgr_013903 [Nepenthes gracilis]|uniref:Uncharacterized protein n=1 Tax=Nepenthes gracilis TaxID=150966 RepID=A0AAD3SK30_NEPGR|nr:hypothetical protein Nepgr_013903 [Nepenthes gracilis]